MACCGEPVVLTIETMTDMLRRLPQVQSLLETERGQALVVSYGHAPTVTALRERLQTIRDGLRNGSATTLAPFDQRFFDCVAGDILRASAPRLRNVINATGIIIHTNLGRSPLASEAIKTIADVARGYSNLELDLEIGKRGSRYTHVESLLCDLTGAEAAIVVNNCAASVVLCLAAFAAGREVVVSRGELVEIGGSFRLPDVIAESGARLREVGATNKTRIADYAAAIGEDTAILLKSHTSNFRIVGFTAAPSRQELSALARDRGVLFIEDLGSGVLVDLAGHGLPDEPVVSDVLKAGADLVMFSGDKLLGGPQAGVIAGRADLIGKLKAHPLLRALRIDKLSLAALEATLRLYVPPNDPFRSIPALTMLAEPVDRIEARAERLASLLAGRGVAGGEVTGTIAYAGGGSLPEQDLESFAVALDPGAGRIEAVAARMRDGDRPALGRISEGRLLLDMRAVQDDEVPALADTVQAALTS
jgi:L-seryl-tRNA(Ser) seleniumtransferase